MILQRSKYFLFSLIFLCSCSASWHINKAIKKDPSIAETVIDTLTFVQSHVDTVYNSDSTYYLRVQYDTVIRQYTYQKYDFSEFKTWWQTLQEEKTKRTEIRNETKAIKTQTRQEEKTKRNDRNNERKEANNTYKILFWVVLGLLALFILIVLRRLKIF